MSYVYESLAFILNHIFVSTARFVATLLAICISFSTTLVLAAPLRPDQAASDFELQLDTRALFDVTKRGDVFALRVSPSRVLSLEFERVIDGADGARTWVGRVREGGSDNVVYLTQANGGVYATLPTSDSIFEIVGRSGEAVVVRDLAARGMRRKLNSGRDYVIPPLLGVPVAEQAPGGYGQKALPTPQTTVDVMIVYTTTFTARYGAGAGVNTRLSSLIAQANDSYIRSEVAITLRLVRSEETSYPNTGDNGIALNAITNGSGAFSTVSASRDASAADLVLLLRPFQDSGTAPNPDGSCTVASDHCGCGIAYVGGAGGTALMSAYGYSVVSEGSAIEGSGYFCPDKSLQHELGHNMGLVHDRANAGGQAGATSYAFGYIIPSTNPSVGDIMSYSQSPVNCFSSPVVFRQGGSCNVTPTTGDVLGVPASNTSNSADAAAALNFTRISVSNFRSEPTVTISGTVTNGPAISGVTFCARPAAGVTCSASTGTGAYSCTLPKGWAGMLHSPSVGGNRIPAQTFSAVNVNTTRNVTGISGTPACNLDVDNNGLIEAETDGVAILRRMLGTTSSGFSGLSGTCAANNNSAAIFNATTPSTYNVTGGSVIPRPGTDGLVILRAMRGLTGTAVTNGLGLAASGATRTDWAASLRNYINTTCGSNFQ